MKKIINTNKAPKVIGPYSQAVKAGGFTFTAGQIPMNLDGELIDGTIEEQTHQVMRNLKAILNEAGVDFENVIKTTAYITDLNNVEKVNEVYKSYFENNYPARETVQVSRLPAGANLEISMIAVKKL